MAHSFCAKSVMNHILEVSPTSCTYFSVSSILKVGITLKALVLISEILNKVCWISFLIRMKKESVWFSCVNSNQ